MREINKVRNQLRASRRDRALPLSGLSFISIGSSIDSHIL